VPLISSDEYIGQIYIRNLCIDEFIVESKKKGAKISLLFSNI
jgi:hypothetical protein